MQKTKIPWCDYTINPVKGLCPMHCKTPDGYEYCYAAGERGLYKRFGWNPEIRFDVQPLLDIERIKTPSRVFVGSTIELFGEWVDAFWLDSIFRTVKDNPQHTFIFLSKCPQNLIKYSPYPPNCWIGASAWDFESTAQAIYIGLARIEAKVKFISFEPLLGETRLHQADLVDAGINWLIIGSQTQPVKHPRPEGVREIICAADQARIPVFVKEPLASYMNIQRREFPDHEGGIK